MPGSARPVVKKAAPKYVAPKPEPVVEVAPVVVEDVVEEEVVVEDDTATEAE
jgi:hypothetical protein